MARISPLVLVPPVVFAGIAAMFLWGMQRDDPGQLPTALKDRPAPAVRLTALPGTAAPFTDASLRDGQVKLVNFWASWCAPCRVEHPNLEAMAAAGLPILGVNYKDDPVRARAFLQELGSPYAALGADPQAQMALDWGVYGVPETFVIDGTGKVLMRFAGPLTQRVIDAQIRPALAEAGYILPPLAPASPAGG